MAKVIYLKGKTVAFLMHDTTVYSTADMPVPRDGVDPTKGIMYTSYASDALNSFDHNEVITIPPSTAQGPVAYLNPMHVIDVRVEEGTDESEIPWGDDFCGSVECDCGGGDKESGLVSAVFTVMDGDIEYGSVDIVPGATSKTYTLNHSGTVGSVHVSANWRLADGYDAFVYYKKTQYGLHQNIPVDSGMMNMQLVVYKSGTTPSPDNSETYNVSVRYTD